MIEEYQANHILKAQKIWMASKWLFVAIGCYLILIILPEQLKAVEIQQEHFRVRVIANSNSNVDQMHKKEIAADVAQVLQSFDINETVDKVSLAKTIKSKYPQTEMRIIFGKHLFPPKLENGEFTPQAYYNSLVVSIGSARGDNWWCSIFKKVCEKDVDKKEKKPVKFWLWEWLKDIFR